MFGKGTFKACGWKWRFLTILYPLSEQNVGKYEIMGLKRKIPTFLIQLMFFQIYPAQYTWVASTVSMQDCSLCMTALGLQLAMGVLLGLECLTFAQSRRATFLADRTSCQQTDFDCKSYLPYHRKCNDFR